MSAGFADVEDGEEGGCLPGRGEDSAHAPLQVGDSGRHRVVGGVLQAGIKIAVRLQVKELAHLVGRVVFESGGLVDGDLSRLPVSWVPARVDTFCFDAVVIVHECSSSSVLNIRSSIAKVRLGDKGKFRG